MIEVHSSKIYDVFAIGFLPGFAYMAAIDDRIITKRLEIRMLLSVVFGLAMTIVGIIISYFTDFSSGAIIVVFGVIIYGIVYAIERYIFNKKDLI